MDGVATNTGRHYAVCVNLMGFVSTGTSALGAPGGSGGSEVKGVRKMQSAIEVAMGSDFAVQLVLMEKNASQAVIAQSLAIKALVPKKLQQGAVWQTRKAVPRHCSNCNQVGLVSVPAQTAMLAGDIRLRNSTKNVQMYMVAFEV